MGSCTFGAKVLISHCKKKMTYLDTMPRTWLLLAKLHCKPQSTELLFLRLVCIVAT